MFAVATRRRDEDARPMQRRLDRLGRSILILYWSAGLLLVLPIALGFWAIGRAARALKRLRDPDPKPLRQRG